MAGYSGTPLPKKLGIKDGTRLALLASPKGFKLAPLPAGVEIRTQARGKLDVILFFATRRRELDFPEGQPAAAELIAASARRMAKDELHKPQLLEALLAFKSD